MNSQEYLAQAAARYKKGDRHGAMADYTEAARLDPKCADAYIGRGVALYAIGDPDGAIADYNQGIRLNPRSVRAYFSRAVARRAKKDMDGAIDDYTEAIRLSPTEGAIYNNRGYTRYEMGDYDGALADCSEAIRLSPNQSSFYHSRGVAYEAKRDYSHARSDYQQSLALKPDHPKAEMMRTKIAQWATVAPAASYDDDDDAFAEMLIRSNIESPKPAQPKPTKTTTQTKPVVQTPIQQQTAQPTTVAPSGNIFMGIIGGVVGAALGAMLWAIVTYVTHWHIGYAAIAIGFLTGYGVRFGGNGDDMSFGIIGAFLALIGCVVGEYLAEYGIVVQVAQTIPNHLPITPALVLKFMGDTFNPIDVVFYLIALYEGFRFSTNTRKKAKVVKKTKKEPWQAF